MTNDAMHDRHQTWKWWSLPLFLTAGWLVYQLTAEPALGATVACLKFGLADIKTGFWLRLRDIRPERGRCLFWYYLTWGFLKIVWISYFAIFAALLCHIYIQSQGSFRDWLAEPLHKILAALITMVVTSLLAVISGSIAVTTAWRCRQKVWLDSEVDLARKKEVWPPIRFTSNQAQTLLGLTACGWLLVGFFVPVIAVSSAIFQAAGGVFSPGLLFIWAVLIGALGIGIMASTQRIFENLRTTTIAAVPAECWDPAERPRSGICNPVDESELVHGEEGPPSLVQ